jgi:2-polyprenyl-3-methyl-5-hydroxy-6-metoxy-1,4-benzoquinol methylase
MVRARSLRPLTRLARPIKALTRSFPKLDAVNWNIQYRLGMWNYLNPMTSTGAEILMIVEKYAPRAKILDLGCGASVNLPLDNHEFGHYHGVDISARAIEIGRSMERPNTSFEVANMLTYETSERYDAILLREILGYFPVDTVAKLLRHLPGLLRQDGIIIIQTSDNQSELMDTVHKSGLSVAELRPRSKQAEEETTIFVVLAP